MTNDGRLDHDQPYGSHIPLTCVNHINKRWSTKNIAPIGSRTLFYNLMAVDGMGEECPCPVSDLLLVYES